MAGDEGHMTGMQKSAFGLGFLILFGIHIKLIITMVSGDSKDGQKVQRYTRPTKFKMKFK